MADIKQIILPDGNTYNLKDTVSTWVGTQAEYDLIQNPDPTVTYFITDSTPFPIPSANAIHYDHTSSELSASNVQDAIDEVNSKTAGDIPLGSDFTDPTSTAYAINQKQNKIKVKSFTATSDAAGNIEIPDLTVANNVLISCMSSNGYATNAVPSGNKFYFKILTNNNPITPMANQTTDCYVLYY